MNVSNGTPGQNTGDNGGFNTQPNQSIPRTQQSMGNTQQPNLSKPNNQMGYQQTGMGNMQQNQQMRYQQAQQMNYGQQGYQQNQQMGYQQTMGQMGYQQPMYPVMPAKSTIGLVGLILSILSLICCGPVLAIPGLICSIVALLRNKHEKRALVGTIIAVVSVILWVILWITGIVSLNSLNVNEPDDVEYDITSELDDEGIDLNDGDIDLEDDIETVPSDSEVGDLLDSDEEVVENDAAENNVGNTGTDVAGEFHPSRVVYNGITLEMGANTATELEEILGYEFDDEDMDYVVNPGYYTYTTYWVAKEPYNRIIYFYFYNDTDSAIPMSQCKLFRLNFYSADYYHDDTLSAWADLDLGSGLTSSSTIDDVMGLLGEPDNTYEDDSNQLKQIEYYKIYDFEYKADFEFKNGQLYEITVGLY